MDEAACDCGRSELLTEEAAYDKVVDWSIEAVVLRSERRLKRSAKVVGVKGERASRNNGLTQ